MRLALLLALLGCLSQVSAFGTNFKFNLQSPTNNQQEAADNDEDSEAQSEPTSSAESEEDLSEAETMDLDSDDDDGNSEESDDDDDSSVEKDDDDDSYEESEDESTSSAETSSGSEEEGGDSEEENSSESGQKRWDYSAYVPKDVLGDKANKFFLMLLSYKAKAATKFLDTTHQKLQSLPAMDDSEGSKGNLERHKFIQAFLGNYAKTLSGSTAIPGVNITELKLCIKKVELLIQLIKDTKQKVEDEPSGSEKIPEILLTSFKTGVAILLDKKPCPSTTTGQDERQKKTPVLSQLKKMMHQKKSNSQQSTIGQLFSGASKLLSAGQESQQAKQALSKLFNSFGQNKKKSNKVFSDGKLTGSISFNGGSFNFGKK